MQSRGGGGFARETRRDSVQYIHKIYVKIRGYVNMEILRCTSIRRRPESGRVLYDYMVTITI